jgi:hypothetical protein
MAKTIAFRRPPRRVPETSWRSVLHWLLHPTLRWDGTSRVPELDAAPPSPIGRRRAASVRHRQ